MDKPFGAKYKCFTCKFDLLLFPTLKILYLAVMKGIVFVETSFNK